MGFIDGLDALLFAIEDAHAMSLPREDRADRSSKAVSDVPGICSASEVQAEALADRDVHVYLPAPSMQTFSFSWADAMLEIEKE